MSTSTLSTLAASALARLREQGCQVHGPGPVTRGGTTPTADPAEPMPGQHVQIVCGHRIVDGFGATAEEAVADALAKLEGYDPQGRTAV